MASPVHPATGVVYPVGLRLLGRSVVVVGGGQVAHRRVAGLLEAQARVTVVSPEVTPALEALVALAAHLGTQARLLLERHRPELPLDDRPPAGLSRLVPVGAQVDQESHRGVVALELWLVARRRS